MTNASAARYAASAEAEALTLTAQAWADKDQHDRSVWFDDHIDQFARERGEFIIAAEKYAKAVGHYGANESLRFRPAEMVTEIIDTADAFLAQELKAWFCD